MRMKKSRRWLSALLAVLMLLTMIPTVAFAAGSASNDSFVRIFHLDCGRKYFSVDQIKAIIDTLSKNNYTHLELAVGNDGLRFLLDEMSVEANNTTYTSDDVKAGIQKGNTSYYNDPNGNALTETEMNTIISYADGKGIEIIPLLNSPGHMDAILDCMEEVGISNPAYSNSARTVDVTNTEAVAFTQALIGKYITYFAGKGCTYFNMGCDEYANDVSNSGFAGLISSGKYGNFVNYVNGLAGMVKTADMIPMAFNDGIYYNSNTSSGTFDSDIAIAYWTSGWPGYSPASASFLAGKGHEIISTNDAWYYVLGRAAGNSSGYTIATAQDGVQNTACTVIPGDNDSTAAGCMICLWCDTPSASYSSTEVSNVTGLLETFATSNPDYFTGSATEDATLEDSGVSVTAPGLISVTAKKADTSTPYTDYTASVTYTITLNDGAYTDSAKVRIPYDSVFNGCTQFIGSVGSDTFSVQRDGDYFVGTVPHFSDVTISGRAADTGSTVDGGIVTVTVGEQDTRTIEGADYSNNIVETELDKSIATVSAKYDQVPGGTEEVKATSITSGSSYYIKNSSGQYLSSSATWVDDISSAALWTVTSNYLGYTLKNGNNYLRYQNRSLSTTTNSRNATTWSFSNGTFSSLIGSFTLGDAYTVTTTNPVNATTVTFAGVAPGTTYVTVGNVRYTINVIAEDLSTVIPLQIDWWITNYPITSTDSNHTADGSYISSNKTVYYTLLQAANAYSENGIEIASTVPATGTFDYAGEEGCVFWKATRLTGNGENLKQTGASGSDSTAVGNTFTYVRYYNGSWAFSVDRKTWTIISSSDQIVAYYLQATKVTKEVVTMTKDWGLAVGVKDGSDSQVALSVAVVYPDGTLSPAEKDIYSTSTMTFNYWENRDIGIVAPRLNDEYEIQKITVTPGTRVPNKSGIFTTDSDDGITWEKKTINDDGDQWFDEESYWDDSMDTTPMVNGTTSSIIWPSVNSAYLVLIYLKPVHYDTNLIVNWVDDSANGALISTMEVAVSSDGTPITFYNGLKQTSALPTAGVGGTFTLDDDAYVTNSSNVNQTFNKNISTVPGVADQYKSGLYQYVSADLSADGMTLTLHYNIDNSKLSKTYVLDFGLPVRVPLSDLVKNPENVTNVELSTENASYDSVNKAIVYTPSAVMTGTTTVTATVTFNDNSTKDFKIGFTPASNVLYEETFLTEDTSDRDYQQWTKNSSSVSTQDIAQTTLYGYDAAYATKFTSGNSMNSSYWAELISGQSTENLVVDITGATGFDLIGTCGPNTGYVYVMLKNTQTGKVILVDTRYNDQTYDSDSTLHQVPLAHAEFAKDAYNQAIIFGMYNSKNSTVEEQKVEVDGFRVYYPTDNDAYKAAPGEKGATYVNVLDAVMDTSKTTVAYIEKHETEMEYPYNKEDYQSKDKGGPQNEIYLAQNQAVAFKVDGASKVQISARAVSDDTSRSPVTITVNGAETKSITSNTEMYYEVAVSDGLVTIENTTGNLLALGNIKLPSGAQTVALTEANLRTVYAMLSAASAPQVFTPDKIDINVRSTKVIRNKVVTLTVTTSTDVSYLLVNNKKVTPANKRLVDWGIADEYVFVVSDVVNRNTDMEYAIYAYDQNSTVSALYTAKG